MQALLFNHPDQDIAKISLSISPSSRICVQCQGKSAQQEPQAHLAMGVGAHLRSRAMVTESAQLM